MRILSLSLLEDLTSRAVKRFIFDLKHILNEVLILSVADAMATGANADLKKIIMAIGEVLHVSKSLHNTTEIDPLLDGNEIMDLTGYNNTPQIGVILNELKLLECSGQIETKEDAVEWLKRKENINSK